MKLHTFVGLPHLLSPVRPAASVSKGGHLKAAGSSLLTFVIAPVIECERVRAGRTMVGSSGKMKFVSVMMSLVKAVIGCAMVEMVERKKSV